MEIISTAQKGIILNKSRNKILAIKYADSNYLPQKLNGKLALPGGKIEFSETPDKSFIREVLEETGITITPDLPFYIWSWTYNKDGDLQQIVAVARLGYYQKGKPLHKVLGEHELKIDGAQWINIKDIVISDFVIDEQPVIKKFLEYCKKNPFIS
jgi:8-oxo-dGTP pyrophosphatase MutT (NUDIX family)